MVEEAAEWLEVVLARCFLLGESFREVRAALRGVSNSSSAEARSLSERESKSGSSEGGGMAVSFVGVGVGLDLVVGVGSCALGSLVCFAGVPIFLMGVSGRWAGSVRELDRTAPSSRVFASSSQRKKPQRLGVGFWHV